MGNKDITMRDNDDETIRLQTRIRDLELALGQRSEQLLATFRFPPVLNNLFGLLLNVPAVTQEMARQRLEITPEVKTAFFRLRKCLTEYCEANKIDPIVIHNRRNVGYWLEDADKLRIREMLALKMRGEVTSKVAANDDAPEAAATADLILEEAEA